MDPEKLKVVELRTELSQRGLDTKGVKSVLVERLRKALEEENANPNASADSANDSEYDEKPTVPQTPKKSSRLSKNAPPPTPTRDTPATKKRRTSRATSYSRKRTSPKKGDQNDTSREPSPAISEPALPEENLLQEESAIPEESAVPEEPAAREESLPRAATTVQKEEKPVPLEKSKKPEIEEPIKQEVENKASDLSKVDEVKIIDNKSSEITKNSTSSENVLQTTVTKSPVKVSDAKQSPVKVIEAKQSPVKVIEAKQSPVKVIEAKQSPVKVIEAKQSPVKVIEAKQSPIKVIDAKKSPVKISDVKKSPSKKIDEADDANQQLVLNVTEKAEKTEDIETTERNENVSKDFEDDKSKAIYDECDKRDNTEKEMVECDEKNVEQINEAQIVKPNDKVEAASVNDAELPTDDSPFQESYGNEDETSTSLTEEQLLEDKDDDLSNNERELDINVNEKPDNQDVEMTEVKHEEDADVDMQDQDANDAAKDRKRKRSPSPVEERPESPAPVIVENEPEIDDSALILSWYDSDLNLVIDKDGFFTAAPMHNDGFSYMWAGARASYGFLCGRVYYEAKIVELCPADAENEEHPHVLRVGWSTPNTAMQLGEEKFSFGYSSTRKKLTGNEFEDYGLEFGKEDVIGCYLDATSDESIVLSYTVNGKDQGPAFNISKEELGDKPLFPHILTKNYSFACNFGQEKPWAEEVLQGYVSIGNVESQYKIPGPRRPQTKEDCEVIMMCGLPASGKTAWATKHAVDHPQKMYNILGLSNLIDKMKDSDSSRDESNADQWETLVNKCTRALDKLLEVAPSRRRNYILDETNVYPSAQRRKMKNFGGYQKKAIVVVPSEEEYKLRAAKHKPIEGKELNDAVLMEMKANFRAPVVGESFDAIEWIDLDQEEGEKLIEKYNNEAKEAGFGRQQASKRPRLDSRQEGARENRVDVRSSRETRDNRDYRDRRGNNYPDRNRNPNWRGGGNMGWRDRPQRGGHARHGGGYGPPVPWRGRGAPIPLVHRGMDRRGSGDRRNDRGRAMNSRQGGWAAMGNYQGSQQSVWNPQNNWSSGQSQGGWGQQNNWGTQQWGSWKSYGQGSYNQSNYNQQSYGSNGNWNSWNQQYYNQYWSQQQPQGGQTSTSGGQTTNKQ